MKAHLIKIIISITLVTAYTACYKYDFFNATPDQLDIEIRLVACTEGPLRKSVAAHQSTTLETSHWYSKGCLMKSITIFKNGTSVFNREFGFESGALTLTQGDKSYTIQKNGDKYTLGGSALY